MDPWLLLTFVKKIWILRDWELQAIYFFNLENSNILTFKNQLTSNSTNLPLGSISLMIFLISACVGLQPSALKMSPTSEHSTSPSPCLSNREKVSRYSKYKEEEYWWKNHKINEMWNLIGCLNLFKCPTKNGVSRTIDFSIGEIYIFLIVV